MSYVDTSRSAPFGAITIFRATSALTDGAARLERWFGHRGTPLAQFSPAELEDIGLSVADVAPPRPSLFGQLAGTVRNWNARRRTIAALGRLSDAQLDDIGLTRWDVDELRSGRATF